MLPFSLELPLVRKAYELLPRLLLLILFRFAFKDEHSKEGTAIEMDFNRKVPSNPSDLFSKTLDCSYPIC